MKSMPQRGTFKGYVTALSSLGSKRLGEVEQRLGFGPGSLKDGYAVYRLDDFIGLQEFEWRDSTRYSSGWNPDPTIKFGKPDDDGNDMIWSVQRRDELRAALGKKYNYDEAKVDAQIDKVMQAALKRLNIRFGSEQIVKVLSLGTVTGYPDSPYSGVPQWELKTPKQFKLIEIVFSDAIVRRLSGRNWWQANEARWPVSTSLGDLVPTFAFKVRKFIEALKAAGARVEVIATRMPRARAEVMSFAAIRAQGIPLAVQIPPIRGTDIIWEHGDEAASRKAAQEMTALFGPEELASVASQHISGKAIDLAITWNLPITVKDAHGREIRIAGPGNGVSSSALHRVGKSFGVIKLVTDGPHWSSSGS